MLPREQIYDFGTRYVIVDAREYLRSARSADGVLERVSSGEARSVIERLVHAEPALLARLYEEVSGLRVSTSNLVHVGPSGGSDIRLVAVLEAFGFHQPAQYGALPDGVRLYLLREPRRKHPGEARSGSPEARRFAAVLAKLGAGPFSFRGHTYVLRSAATLDVGGRASYETLSEAELVTTLQGLRDEPGLDSQKKELLGELLGLVEIQRSRGEPTELLLLRRQRSYAYTIDEGPALTPSQVRKSLELHWIEVATVDPDGKPVPGVAIELELSDKSTRTVVSDADGFARAQPVPAGNALIRLPKIDGSGWKAAGAQPSGKAAPDRTHVVKQGECLSKIAHSYGFADWKPVWQHDKNAGLRKKRKSPHVLYPGDQLVVPGLRVHQIERATDATHKIEIKAAVGTVELALTFKDVEGAALTGAYEVRWGGGPEPKLSGNLDGGGGLKEQIPVGVKEVELHLVESGQRYVLTTSHLDPTEDDSGTFLQSGIAARLAALGYWHSAADADTPESLGAALLHFQREAMGQEEPTGELDATTCQKLEELYGV